jgi:hypothetical protein
VKEVLEIRKQDSEKEGKKTRSYGVDGWQKDKYGEEERKQQRKERAENRND